MGVDTKLLLNPKWDIEDIVTVLEKHQGIKAELSSKAKIHSTYFVIDCDNGRSINLHFCQHTPLGTATLLSLRANQEGCDMLKGIAKILGGFFNPNDCESKYEEFMGYFWDEDALTYQHKYAVLNKELKNEDDIEGLLLSHKKWHNRHG